MVFPSGYCALNGSLFYSSAGLKEGVRLRATVVLNVDKEFYVGGPGVVPRMLMSYTYWRLIRRPKWVFTRPPYGASANYLVDYRESSDF